jgi:plasmid maintenance system antidote protein VapI
MEAMKTNHKLKRKIQHLAVDHGGNFRTLAEKLGVTRRTVWNVIYGRCGKDLALKIVGLSNGEIEYKELRMD